MLVNNFVPVKTVLFVYQTTIIEFEIQSPNKARSEYKLSDWSDSPGFLKPKAAIKAVVKIIHINAVTTVRTKVDVTFSLKLEFIGFDIQNYLSLIYFIAIISPSL